MVQPIIVRDLIPVSKRGRDGVYNSSAEMRGGRRPTGPVGPDPVDPMPEGVIFFESFDDQPDWHSAMHSTDRVQRAGTHTIPNGWLSIRQDPTWAPSMGHPDRHESIEILASNADKARNGVGKAFVAWRDCHDPGWKRWNSESMMVKHFPGGHDQLYAEFWVAFSPDWTPFIPGKAAAGSKLFRFYAWDETPDTEYSFFSDGNSGPLTNFNYSANSYGVRNSLAFRGGPYSQNYLMTDNEISGLTRSLAQGDVSLNFTTNTVGSTLRETDPRIPDKVNGGFLGKSSSDIVTHEQIFGPGGTYTKIGLFVKMNSAPGVQDGWFMQWLDDELIVETRQVTWTGPNPENILPKWNCLAIGGNDFFQQMYPNEERREEWYAIDDLLVRTDIPENLL